MTDCMNAAMRDQLPDYLHGQLAGRARATVAAHLAGCADCRAELALLASARAALAPAPAVDVARVAAAVSARRPAAPRLAGATVLPLVRRRWTAAPVTRAAAAVLLVAALAGLPALVQRWGGQAGPGAADTLAAVTRPGGAGDTGGAVAADPRLRASLEPAAGAVPEITFGGGLGDLSEGAITELISELEALEALPDPEPAQRPLVEPLGDPLGDD